MARIGVQASTIKTAFAELGPYEAMRRIADVGYRSVEISQVAMTPGNVDQMCRAQEDHGVEVVALSAALTPPVGRPGDALTVDYDKIVGDCRTLGTSILRIGMLPFDAMGSRERVLAFAQQMEQMTQRLAGDGIALCYHNHHVEFARLDGRLMLEVIADEAPAVGLELDVHWIHRGGLDPVRVLARYAERVRLVHLKDYRIGLMPDSALELLAQGDAAGVMAAFGNLVQFAEVGEGTLEFAAIIEQALASGAEHLLVEQDDTYGRDPFESLAISRRNLVDLGYEQLL